MQKAPFFVLALIFFTASTSAQILQEGFNPEEYLECMQITVQQSDTNYVEIPVGPPANYSEVYHSPDMGLDNQYDVWLREDGLVVLSIRGSVGRKASWLENFYAAMLPAKGELHLNDTLKFNYNFAELEGAKVHAGWTIGMAFLGPHMLEKVLSFYQEGYRDFILVGHSQGGALATLMGAYFHHHPKFPKDIRLKTYASAAPKLGNTQFVYDYNAHHLNWTFRIVNTEDWVPQMPVSVQYLNDFGDANPLEGSKEMMKQLPVVQRVVLRKVFKKINKETEEAMAILEKYLGKRMHGFLEEYLPEFERPEFAASENYLPCGTEIILLPDTDYPEYVKTLPQRGVFTHHMYQPYVYLIKKRFSL